MPKRTGRRWREHTVPRVLRRDNGICHLCGRPGADTADHLIPWSQFPPDEQHRADHPSNLAAAHNVPCNQLRGDRSITWARAELAKRMNVSSSQSGVGWDW